jgi:acyl phosphate:glycerol-3-phosphate acyltransferase
VGHPADHRFRGQGGAILVVLTTCGLIALAYLIGSLSPAVFLGKWLKGIDIREYGSGNPGTTNALRVLGTPLGATVLVLDILKGFLPVLLARFVAGPVVVVLVAVAALVGHNWSVFLRGRGGKGVATGAGTILAMMPLALVALVAAFLAVLLGTSYVSLASLTAAVLFPVLTIASERPMAFVVYSVVGAAIVAWAHRGNIRRLVRGEERKIDRPWRRGAGPDGISGG